MSKLTRLFQFFLLACAAWLTFLPAHATNLAGIATIAAGGNHTCARTTAGGVKCWGNNFYGQLGNGTTTQASLTPVAVTGLASGVTAIATGNRHTCARTTAGGVKCWGNNQYGQLGNNSTTGALTPVAVTGLSSGVTAIAAGYYHTCALTTAGGVKCWGNNDFGQLGNTTTTRALTPAAVTGLTSGVAAIAAGRTHTCALTTAGGVQCWGNNDFGQLGNGTNTQALTPVAVTGLTSGVAAIATGANHTCARTTAGGMQCWGSNEYGQLGNNSSTDALTPVAMTWLASGVTAIAMGFSHTCALTTAGGMQCWGFNGVGQLGNNSTTGALTPVAVT
ncbi:MAG: RCC1 repeat-containing protein, partial [Pseudomonadota bacterium]